MPVTGFGFFKSRDSRETFFGFSRFGFLWKNFSYGIEARLTHLWLGHVWRCVGLTLFVARFFVTPFFLHIFHIPLLSLFLLVSFSKSILFLLHLIWKPQFIPIFTSKIKIPLILWFNSSSLPSPSYGIIICLLYKNLIFFLLSFLSFPILSFI